MPKLHEKMGIDRGLRRPLRIVPERPPSYTVINNYPIVLRVLWIIQNKWQSGMNHPLCYHGIRCSLGFHDMTHMLLATERQGTFCCCGLTYREVQNNYKDAHVSVHFPPLDFNLLDV